MKKNTYNNITEILFDNGFRLLFQERHGFPTASILTSYGVGGMHTLDGKIQASGIAHFLEHLAFKPLSDGKDISYFDKIGGIYNAETKPENTVYKFYLPSKYINDVIDFEISRMKNVILDAEQIENERSIILQEERDLFDDKSHKFFTEDTRYYYANHPYGRSTIGTKEDILSITLENIKDFYNYYYCPLNCTMIIVGSVELNEIIKMINNAFEKNIPSISTFKAPSLPTSIDNKQLIQDKCILSGKNISYDNVITQNFIYIYPTCKSGLVDDYILMLITFLLDDGQNSILGNSFKKTGFILNLSAANITRKYHGTFRIGGKVKPGTPLHLVESFVKQSLAKIYNGSFSIEEFKRAKKKCIAHAKFSVSTCYDLAEKISSYDIHYSVMDIDYFEKNINRISYHEIISVAKTYFKDASPYLCWQLPNENITDSVLTDIGTPLNAEKFKDNYGMDVLFGHKDIPYIDYNLHFLNLFKIKDTKPELITLLELLMLSGIEGMNEELLHSKFDDIGATVDFDSGCLSGKCLPEDLEQVYNLIYQIVFKLEFTRHDFDLKKEQLLEYIDQLVKSPSHQISNRMYSVIYKNYPYEIPSLGIKEDIINATFEDVQREYKKITSINNMVLIFVGNIQYANQIKTFMVHDDISKSISYHDVELTSPELIIPLKDSTRIVDYINIDGTESITICFAHLGIHGNSDDLYKLLIFDNIFGLGSGMNNRLFRKLRERKGLCYSVTASISNTCDLVPGIFDISVTSSPDNHDEVIREIFIELNEIMENGISNDELEDIKEQIIINYNTAFEQDECIAGYLYACYLYNKPLTFYKDLAQKIRSITKEEVKEAINKYIDPLKLNIVIAGNTNAVKNKRIQ